MDGTMSEIRLFAPNFAPKNWAFCSGQLLNVSTNQALFSLLGTTYGGNGVNTFALPDFRGRIPAGTGAGLGVTQFPLGAVMGSNNVTALLSNLPMHNHAATGSFTMSSYSDTGDSSSATNNNLAILQGLYSDKAANASLKSIVPTITVNLTGNTQPISVQQPYLGLNYIICLQGVYPSRN
ncbi:phage tail protein [Flavobacterium sharifuzzamanii]|uniref:phage tail protein n=1 Tax=Flavobacterium sharifuzzamanii TaxID=2211133 RepID=UPI000DAE0CD5|nr:tail fiber protein [Flavobacterium sharifuzzamanii]KAF2082460.1 phage tail protein [Flavobacterium sharifuzzamanii]